MVMQSNILPGPDNLDQFEKVYLKKSRTWFTPDVVELIAPDGARFVMKDWSTRPLLFRNTYCRIAAKREMQVYETLRGMEGIPQLISKLGDLGFVMEWLDARPLPGRKMADILGLEFFDHLEDVVAEMHRRGIAHGDLRRRNILRGVDGEPRLIDFETAVHANKSSTGGRVFKAICEIDRITVLKIRCKYFPDSLSPEEQTRLQNVPWHLSLGRYFRKEIYGRLTPKGRRKRAKKLR